MKAISDAKLGFWRWRQLTMEQKFKKIINRSVSVSVCGPGGLLWAAWSWTVVNGVGLGDSACFTQVDTQAASFAINAAIDSWTVKAPRGIRTTSTAPNVFVRSWLEKSSDPHIRDVSSVVAREVAEFVACWWLV